MECPWNNSSLNKSIFLKCMNSPLIIPLLPPLLQISNTLHSNENGRWDRIEGA